MKYFNVAGLSPQEIKDNLEAEAYKIEESEYFQPFTEPEMLDLESDYLDTSKEVQKLEDEKKRLLEPIQKSLKEFKELEKDLKRKVTDGGEEKHGRVYLMADRDAGQMVKVNDMGDIIGSRAMTAKERQIFIGEQIRKIS